MIFERNMTIPLLEAIEHRAKVCRLLNELQATVLKAIESVEGDWNRTYIGTCASTLLKRIQVLAQNTVGEAVAGEDGLKAEHVLFASHMLDFFFSDNVEARDVIKRLTSQIGGLLLVSGGRLDTLQEVMTAIKHRIVPCGDLHLPNFKILNGTICPISTDTPLTVISPISFKYGDVAYTRKDGATFKDANGVPGYPGVWASEYTEPSRTTRVFFTEANSFTSDPDYSYETLASASIVVGERVRTVQNIRLHLRDGVPYCYSGTIDPLPDEDGNYHLALGCLHDNSIGVLQYAEESIVQALSKLPTKVMVTYQAGAHSDPSTIDPSRIIGSVEDLKFEHGKVLGKVSFLATPLVKQIPDDHKFGIRGIQEVDPDTGKRKLVQIISIDLISDIYEPYFSGY